MSSMMPLSSVANLWALSGNILCDYDQLPKSMRISAPKNAICVISYAALPGSHGAPTREHNAVNIFGVVQYRLGKSTPKKSSTYLPIIDLVHLIITFFKRDDTLCHAVTLPTAPKSR